MIQVLLASASPARFATLQSAGVTPLVEVSDVDEDAVIAELLATTPDAPPQRIVLELARAKATAVASSDQAAAKRADVLVACDSMLEIDGEVVGKPRSADVAIERWRRMRGNNGVLHTGHWVVDLRNRPDTDEVSAADTLVRSVGATESTTVHFADLSDAEIEAYVATGEPLQVAGGFTVDGQGGAFVRAIEGDYHNVVGISLPLVRGLFAQVGINWTDCWSTI
ncbi:septum formation protein [Micrococcales bacterium KH10]|nr:septum formation protein [Micrococcales bacterium KH10]